MLQLRFSHWLLRCFISGLLISLLQTPTEASELQRSIGIHQFTNENLPVPMVLLHIALQEGFLNDSVIIRANQQEIFRQQSVTTRTQIGLAKSIEINLPAGNMMIDVIVSSKGVVQSIPLQLSESVYLGISLTPDGKLNSKTSRQPFGYL